MTARYTDTNDATNDRTPCVDCHGEGGYWVPFVEPDEWADCPTCDTSALAPKADA